jgi:DNA mismatch repair protein MutS
MRQYLDAKDQHRDSLLLFRMGDFYEIFYDDALVASRALDLTLTSRSKDTNGGGIPMCGVPWHAVDTYIARLVKKGFRVAICDQVEDPRKAKGVVKREVVRVVSPGTLTDTNVLDAREPAFLMAVAPTLAARGPQARGGGVEKTASQYGVALLDLSTGEFTAAEYSGSDAAQLVGDEIAMLKPRELVVPSGAALPATVSGAGITVTSIDGWAFDHETASRMLLQQLKAGGLEGFGLDGHEAAVSAAGALVHHLRGTQKVDLAHVTRISFRQRADALLVDPTTLKHLEVLEGSEGGREGSLLAELDRTMTSIGSRQLRSWLLRPLVAIEPIRDRLDAVEELAFRATERGKFREAIKPVQDLERLLSRAALGTAGPRDLVGLKQSLAVLPRLRTVLADCQSPLVQSLLAQLDDLADVRDAVERSLIDDPPALGRDGGFIRDGCDPEIDELRRISRSGKQVIAEMEERERARTGIGSLKVRYNRVFGYYIEISKSNLHAVPVDYQRKQTIAGGERFVTPALKEYEEKVLGADERILERELDLLTALRGAVAAEAIRIQASARAVAALDVLAALADVASLNNYTKPHVHDGDEFWVVDGRHPVVERRIAPSPTSTDGFVPNDITLNGTTCQLMILTGPNMGGKSTYLRQTALLCLMAQAGSFVPAKSAKTPLLDRVFARVGASDNIARGQSTFMVEMQETANILNQATSRSLVVLDEIGRGTSTFDGLSIAWAVAEYLATHPRTRPKTLFATHYHELTDLADATPGVVNYHVAAREWKDEIVFLRKIVPGRSDRSYGIQVARLAGLPSTVIARAREILQALEQDELSRGGRPSLSGTPTDPRRQLALFQAPVNDPVRDALEAVDVNRLTPLEALTLIADLKKQL